MSGKRRAKASRLGVIAMHSGFVVWGVCLIVLAEEHREGAESSVAERPSEADAAEARTAKTRSWVEKRIEALGDPVFGVRAKATRQLLAAGSQAVEPLALALKSQDPEIARRSRYILERVVRGDQAGFLALEKIAVTPGHPSAPIAESIVHTELDRREQVMAVLAEQRQIKAQKFLREARTALYQGRFDEAREKAVAAHALDVQYKLFDDRPDLVLNAIQQAKARVSASKAAPVITADREVLAPQRH